MDGVDLACCSASTIAAPPATGGTDSKDTGCLPTTMSIEDTADVSPFLCLIPGGSTSVCGGEVTAPVKCAADRFFPPASPPTAPPRMQTHAPMVAQFVLPSPRLRRSPAALQSTQAPPMRSSSSALWQLQRRSWPQRRPTIATLPEQQCFSSVLMLGELGSSPRYKRHEDKHMTTSDEAAKRQRRPLLTLTPSGVLGPSPRALIALISTRAF